MATKDEIDQVLELIKSMNSLPNVTIDIKPVFKPKGYELSLPSGKKLTLTTNTPEDKIEAAVIAFLSSLGIQRKNSDSWPEPYRKWFATRHPDAAVSIKAAEAETTSRRPLEIAKASAPVNGYAFDSAAKETGHHHSIVTEPFGPVVAAKEVAEDTPQNSLTPIDPADSGGVTDKWKHTIDAIVGANLRLDPVAREAIDTYLKPLSASDRRKRNREEEQPFPTDSHFMRARERLMTAVHGVDSKITFVQVIEALRVFKKAGRSHDVQYAEKSGTVYVFDAIIAERFKTTPTEILRSRNNLRYRMMRAMQNEAALRLSA
jgi:hypothetical protein